MSAGSSLTTAESRLLLAMNHARTSRGLAPLRVDPTLVRAARSYTRTLVAIDRLSHAGLIRRLTAAGVRGPIVGENLAWGVGYSATPRGIVRAWLRSPSHRRNLLRPGFRRVGVGSRYGSFGGYARARVVAAEFAGS